MKQFAILSLFLVALTACHNNHETLLSSQDSKFGVQELTDPQVVGPKGEPIVGAKVMIGDTSSGRQFLTTDTQGYFKAPADWKSAEVISVLADGYTRASFYGQTPKGQIFQLRLLDKKAAIEVKGNISGFDPYMTEKDGNVDFGLVLPMLKKEEIYFFNENQVLSAENDYIEVFGQKIPVPSNVSLPKQKEKYGFVTFTLEKPIYRLKLSYPGDYQMFAIRARTTVKALKDKMPPLELLNEVIVGGGSERSVSVPSTGASLDFTIGDMQFPAKMGVTAPADVPNGMVMLSMPLVHSGNYLYPSDVKTMKARETRQLSVPSTGANDMLNVVLASDRNANHAASASLMPVGSMSQALQFLGMVNKPSGDMQKVVVARPTMPTGVEPGGMYVTLSSIETQKIDDVTVELPTRLWELYLSNWNEQILLPTLPSAMQLKATPNTKYRWEVSFMAADNTKLATQSREVVSELVKDVTYVTRNSSDF